MFWFLILKCEWRIPWKYYFLSLLEFSEYYFTKVNQKKKKKSMWKSKPKKDIFTPNTISPSNSHRNKSQPNECPYLNSKRYWNGGKNYPEWKIMYMLFTNTPLLYSISGIFHMPKKFKLKLFWAIILIYIIIYNFIWLI